MWTNLKIRPKRQTDRKIKILPLLMINLIDHTGWFLICVPLNENDMPTWPLVAGQPHKTPWEGQSREHRTEKPLSKCRPAPNERSLRRSELGTLSVPSQIHQLAKSFLLPRGGGTEGVRMETCHIFPSMEWSGNYLISMEIIL